MTINRISWAAAAMLTVGFASPALSETFEVKMLNRGAKGIMVFEPDVVKIKPGDTVRFVSTDKGHNAATMRQMWPEGAEPFTGKISQDVEVTFKTEGVHGIQCTPHLAAGMVAVVVVGEPKNLEAAKAVKLPGIAGRRMTEILAGL